MSASASASSRMDHRQEADVLGQFLYSVGAVPFSESAAAGYFALHAYENPTARGGTVWWGDFSKSNGQCWLMLEQLMYLFRKVFEVRMRGPAFKQYGEPFPRYELEVEFEAALALMTDYADDVERGRVRP